MFTKQLALLLIITIGPSSTQCGDPQTSCPKDEEYVKQCMAVVTCESRVHRNAEDCDGQCVCLNKTTSRNHKNECIAPWECPGVCPPDSFFKSCKASHVFYDTENGLTAEEFIEACKPECYCRPGYFWHFRKRECFKKIYEGFVIHEYLHFG